MKIETFIDELRNSDGYIEHIYTKGGCYRFHILLSKMYKNTTPFINETKDHIVTRYRKKYYDVYGEVYEVKDYRVLDIEDIPMVEKWNFRKNNLLVLDECPNCEEPLFYGID